jgi:hypothetical protein
MIKAAGERRQQRMEIDLTGPDGNAFALLGLARRLAKQTGRDPQPILNKMKSGNYANLVRALDEEFGEFLVLYR